MLAPTLATDPRPAPPPIRPGLASGPPSTLAWSHASETSDLAVFSWQGRDSLHARYYNPNVARFLSVDPAGGKPASPQSWNRYAYVRNNPIKKIDADGAEDGDAYVSTQQREQIREIWGEQAAQRYDRQRLSAGVAALAFLVGGAFAAEAAPVITSALLTGKPQQVAQTIGSFLEPGPGNAGGTSAVMLGETMSRVKPAAQSLGAAVFDAPWTNAADIMAKNMAWLGSQIKQGATILDIGLDTARALGSKFYAAEVKLLRESGYVRQFSGWRIINGERTAVWQWVKQAEKQQ